MIQVFLATPSNRPETGRAASQAGDEQFPWDLLVSRSLHPLKVEVIEAMRWIGRPLAASDLCRVFDKTYELALIDYHVKVLADLGGLRRIGTEKVRGALKHYYVLVERSDW